MLEPKVRLFLSSACAVVLIASGCLSMPADDLDKELDAGWGEDDQPAAGTHAGDPWEPGTAWRYAVSGSRVEEPGFVTVGVVARTSSGFLLGSDSPKEAARAAAGIGGPLVGPVQAGSLAPEVEGRVIDLLGLERDAGESWRLSVWGSSFTMVKGETGFVEGAKGHKVAGAAADGRTLRVEYNKAAGWFVSLRLLDRDGGLLLGYRLVEVIDGHAGGLESWQVLDGKRVQASPERIGRLEWLSQGEADRVLVHVQVTRGEALQRSESGSSLVGGLLDQAKDLLGGLSASTAEASAGVAAVTVLAPDGRRVVELRGLELGTRLVSVADEPGTWRAVVSTAGHHVELIVIPVQIERYDP